MSGFSIELEAHLNLSNIEAELKSINNRPITLSNFQVDTGGIAQKIQQGLNGQAFSINLSNANMSRMTGQLKAAGTHMGNQLSNSINSSLNKLNVSSKNVSTISGMLAGAGLDPKSIAKVTRGLDGMAVSVGKITTKEFGNGNIRMMIDGIDQLGRAVQITRDFNKETGDVLNTSTKFSQKFGENMAASNKQFNNLLNTAKRAAKEGDLKNSIGAIQKRFEAIGSLGGQKTAGAYRGIKELRQLAGVISNPKSSPDQVVSAYERFGSVLNTTGNEMNALTRDNSTFLAQQAKASSSVAKSSKGIVADYQKARAAVRSESLSKTIGDIKKVRGELSGLGSEKLSGIDSAIERLGELQRVMASNSSSPMQIASAYRKFNEEAKLASNNISVLKRDNDLLLAQQKEDNGIYKKAMSDASGGKLSNLGASIGKLKKEYDSLSSLGGSKLFGVYSDIKELGRLQGMISNPRSTPDQVVSAYERFQRTLESARNEIGLLKRDSSDFLSSQNKVASSASANARSITSDYKKARAAAKSNEIENTVSRLNDMRSGLDSINDERLSHVDKSLAKIKSLSDVITSHSASPRGIADAYRSLGMEVKFATNSMDDLRREYSGLISQNKNDKAIYDRAISDGRTGKLNEAVGKLKDDMSAISGLGGGKLSSVYSNIKDLNRLQGVIRNPRSSVDEVASAYGRFNSVLEATRNSISGIKRANSDLIEQNKASSSSQRERLRGIAANYSRARSSMKSGEIAREVKELDASRGALSYLGADKLSSLDASIARAKELQGVLSGPNMSAKNMATAYRDFGEAVASARNQVKSLNIENAEAIKQQSAKVKDEQSAVAHAKELLNKQGQFAADESKYQGNLSKIKGTGHSLIGEIIKDHESLIAAQNGMRRSLVRGDDSGLAQWYSRYTGISDKIKNEMTTALNETSSIRRRMEQQSSSDDKLIRTALKYGEKIGNGELGKKIAEAGDSMRTITNVDPAAASKMNAWISQMNDLKANLTAPGADTDVSAYVRNYEQFQSLASKVSNLKSETLNASAVAMDAAGIKKDFIDNNKLAAQIQSARTTLNELAGTGHPKLDGITQTLQNVEGLYSQITGGGLSSQEIVNKFGEIRSGLDSVTYGMREVKEAYKNVVNPEDVSKFGSKMDEWMNSNTRAAKKYASELSNIQSVRDKLLRGEGNISDLKKVEADFAKVQHDAAVKGFTGKSLASRMKDSFLGVLGRVASASIMYQGMRAVKSMYDNVLKVDTAMTELKKVTNETDYAYDRFLSGSEKEAQRLGTTVDGLVNSTADFARLGYGFKDSQYLAKAANIYAVVGDEVGGVDNATKSIISTMAAFGVKADDSMSIVDKFNEVGKFVPKDTVMYWDYPLLVAISVKSQRWSRPRKDLIFVK